MNNHTQNFATKTLPMSHQIEVINYIHNHDIIALFDEQGLGKTKIVIDALSMDMHDKKIEGVLVISPMSLVYNWEQEVKKHSYLIPIVLKGSNREKRYKYLTGANFYITNYESVVTELQRIKRFCKSRIVGIVLDESARVKDPYSKTSQAVFQLSELSRKRIIISGTPVANKPYDLWAQYYFLDHGKLLGNDFEKFKAKLNIKNSNYHLNLIELKECINKNSVRRLKSDVLKLPEKEYINIFVELSGNQLALYNKLTKELVIEITNINGEIIIDESQDLLKKLLRLIQITSNPYVLDKSYKETSIKFKKLDELTQQIILRGEKIIIWTCFIENVLSLKSRYKQFAPLVIYGDIPIKERVEAVYRFQNTADNKIMILNPSAAREGLTLTSANNAIYVDRNFNLVDYLQSQDRIHRISQEKKCNIYKIIAKNTIDEYIDSYLDFKRDIAGFVQNDTNVVNDKTVSFIVNKSRLLKMIGG